MVSKAGLAWARRGRKRLVCVVLFPEAGNAEAFGSYCEETSSGQPGPPLWRWLALLGLSDPGALDRAHSPPKGELFIAGGQ